MKITLYFAIISFSCQLCAQSIRIGTPLADTPQRKHIQQLVKTAYKTIGIEPEFIPLPSQRRLMLLQEGLIDADLYRICQLDTGHHNLLVIPFELDTMQLSAYTLDASKLTGWLQRRDLLISHIRGFKMAEQQQFAGKRVMVNNAEQAFGLMLQGRVDIVLEDSDTALPLLQQFGSSHSITSQTVVSFGVCHVLSQQQHKLLPALTTALQSH